MSKTADIPLAGALGPFEFPIGDELRGERATLGRSLLDVQRDLRIKAAYIAAIENVDPSVFPNPSFIPGYVRSYARYLGLDPEEVYARFRAESGLRGPEPGRGTRRDVRSAKPGAGVFRPDFPMAEPRWRGLPVVPLSAIGSLLVLAGLVGGLGYGGWTVLQNIQRVQFAPVEEAPVALVAVAPVAAPATADTIEPALSELARPVAATALAELYRRQEVEVPILAPRDGPIAALDPNQVGLLALAGASRAQGPAAPRASAARSAPAPGAGPELAALIATGAGVVLDDPARGEATATPAPGAEGLDGAPQLTAERPALTVVAERAAWIRVYLADKTVIFERILETGESYSPPTDLAEPLIWAGNSGSVYVRLGDTLRGPLGSGTRAVRDVVLEPAAIAARFAEVAEVPDVLSRAEAPALEAAAVALQ